VRDHLVQYLDATENLMIFLMEQRDRPEASKKEIVLCNKIYRACEILYWLLRTVIRKEI